MAEQFSVYGFFCGGDPRAFRPDASECSEAELANHKAACDLANDMESRGELPDWDCPSGWAKLGESVVHVLRAPFGIGIQTIFVEDDESEVA